MAFGPKERPAAVGGNGLTVICENDAGVAALWLDFLLIRHRPGLSEAGYNARGFI